MCFQPTGPDIPQIPARLSANPGDRRGKLAACGFIVQSFTDLTHPVDSSLHPGGGNCQLQL